MAKDTRRKEYHRTVQVNDKYEIKNDQGDIELGRVLMWNDPKDPTNSNYHDKSYSEKDAPFGNFEDKNKGTPGLVEERFDKPKFDLERKDSRYDNGLEESKDAYKYSEYTFEARHPINFDNLVPISFKTTMYKKMFKNLCVPSAVHAYSVGIEFFKQWVLGKFDDTYFKTVYTDGKHLFDDFANLNESSLIKRGKPAIGFFPTLDMEFNRDNVDMINHDLMYFARTSDGRDAFFKDRERNLYISAALEVFKLDINVKIKVNTRAKQLDLAKYLKMALAIGATNGYYLDIDMHVPYEMLFAIAEETGFEVDYEKLTIKDPYTFLMYLNSKSDMPFIYKIRNINSRNEFFIRASNMFTHIQIPSLSIDDGERQGMVSSNYYVEFTAEMRMPAPKLYCLFTAKRNDIISFTDKGGNIRSYVTNFTNIPTLNEKGWEQFVTLDYQEEDRSKPLEIDLNELFEGDLRISKLIKYEKDNFISPSKFIDFKIYNRNRERQFIVDWDKMKLTTKYLMDYELTEIVVYIDKEYLNTQFTVMNTDLNNRVDYNTSTGSNRNQSLRSEQAIKNNKPKL